MNDTVSPLVHDSITPALAARFADEWDQVAFDPDAETYPLEHFEPMVREVFAAPGLKLAEWPQQAEALLPVPDLRVQGDAYLLRQALHNLIDNAIAFSPPGAVVALDAQAEGQGVRLQVADHGAGIPDYARERVFERFYSLARPGSGRRSSGLGLPFVQEVARLHDGRASVQARDGGGTVASLWLPLGAPGQRARR